MVAYVSEWLEIFQADAEFANQRIQEFRESVANCENLTSRARNVITALMAKDSVTVSNVPDISDPSSVPEAGGISDEIPDQAVVAQLRDLSCRLRSTTRDLHKVSEERVIEAQSSKVILDRAEDLLSEERQSLEQWLFFLRLWPPGPPLTIAVGNLCLRTELAPCWLPALLLPRSGWRRCSLF